MCTESALNALRRHVPQIYLSNDRLLFDPKTIRVDQSDFEAAIRKITPAASRNPLSSVVPRALAPELQPLLRTHLERIADMLFDEIFPVLSHKQKISFVNRLCTSSIHVSYVSVYCSSDLAMKKIQN